MAAKHNFGKRKALRRPIDDRELLIDRVRLFSCHSHGHNLFFLVQHGAVHTKLLGLTVLEELGRHLREQSVAEYVLFLLIVVTDLFAVLLEFRREYRRRDGG